MSSSSQSNPLFYRGDMDDQIVTMPNGAKVNKAYADFIDNGPWATPKLWHVTEGVYSVSGNGLANFNYIEGDTGIILFDTGGNAGMGLDALKQKEKFSDKPISAIIYSHHHYGGGTHAVLAQYPDRDIPIYGHPDVDKNLVSGFYLLGGASARRGPMMMGSYLPEQGEDAFYAIEEPEYEELMLRQHGHMGVTHPVADGETVVIDGVTCVFHHVIADTMDSLMVHLPERNTVLHNAAVMPFLFPLYTLRGDFYRSVPDMIAAIDKIRHLQPEHLLGCHGVPTSGQEAVQELLTTNRDAYAWLFQQAVQGINAGKTPDQLAASIQLPKRLADFPGLFPAYVDVEYVLRGIYRGLIGWWAEDTADLHPPQPEELDAVLVEGFGGAATVIAKAREAQQAKKYNLAAKLLSIVLNVEPDHAEAKQLKADILRHMGQTTLTGVQTRSYYLTEALHLEGKVDRMIPPQGKHSFPPPNLDSLMSFPLGSFVSLLQYRLNADKAADLIASVQINYSDIGRSFGLLIRQGVVEFIDGEPAAADVRLDIARLDWIKIIIQQSSIDKSLEEGLLTVSGDQLLWQQVRDAYAGIL